jgi:outer membrane lipoprotein SlyB
MSRPLVVITPQRRRYLVKAFKMLAVLAVIFSLGGCGTMVGAGAGGLAGNQFGKGTGKTAATIGGVVGGGLLGHALTGD